MRALVAGAEDVELIGAIFAGVDDLRRSANSVQRYYMRSDDRAVRLVNSLLSSECLGQIPLHDGSELQQDGLDVFVFFGLDGRLEAVPPPEELVRTAA